MVSWPSQTKQHILQPDLEPIGCALLGGTWKEIAAAAFRVKELRSELIKCTLKQLSVECFDITSSKSLCLLRKSAANDICSLSICNICQEIKDRAPMLCSVLMTMATSHNSINKDATWFPSVATAGAVLLKQRCCMINSVQILILILSKYSGFQVFITKIFIVINFLFTSCGD